MKEKRFKALTKENEIINDIGLIELFSDGIIIVNDVTPIKQLLQYINLKDKNGKEIYENDELRIKGYMGENKEYYFDAIYKVSISYDGVNLSFSRLYNIEPDSKQNSYPICQNASFKNIICVDYVNKNYDHICFQETHGENHLHGNTWKEHWYSNDIEIL